MHRATGSFYRAISAEAYSKHGFNASMVIYDELHAAPDRRLYDVLSTSMGARKQPLLLVISTAGYDRHSILWELYAHAKKVQEQPAIDPSFLPILYEAPDDADWTKRRVWQKANPALGDFRSLEEMQILAARAKEIPAQENNFRRLYLNQWTEQASRWIVDARRGMRCLAPIDRAALAGRRCYVGMDLSTTTDLTALVAVFPDETGFDVLAQFFVPAERIRGAQPARPCPVRRVGAPGRAHGDAGRGRRLRGDPARAAGVGRGVLAADDRPSTRGTRPTWSRGCSSRTGCSASRCARASRRSRRRPSRSSRRSSAAGCGMTAHPVLRWNVSATSPSRAIRRAT